MMRGLKWVAIQMCEIVAPSSFPYKEGHDMPVKNVDQKHTCKFCIRVLVKFFENFTNRLEGKQQLWLFTLTAKLRQCSVACKTASELVVDQYRWCTPYDSWIVHRSREQ